MNIEENLVNLLQIVKDERPPFGPYICVFMQ